MQRFKKCANKKPAIAWSFVLQKHKKQFLVYNYWISWQSTHTMSPNHAWAVDACQLTSGAPLPARQFASGAPLPARQLISGPPPPARQLTSVAPLTGRQPAGGGGGPQAVVGAVAGLLSLPLRLFSCQILNTFFLKGNEFEKQRLDNFRINFRKSGVSAKFPCWWYQVISRKLFHSLWGGIHTHCIRMDLLQTVR